MRSIGFSTGALALGDFRKALQLISGRSVQAVELSALRDHEVERLMAALPSLDLSAFRYVSVHAPSRFARLAESQVVELLTPCIERRIPVVLHPDAIDDPSRWKRFGELLCIENMDNRKHTGRTASELEQFFEKLPRARFCLDLAHARQVDPTMTAARTLLQRFGDRLMQIHLSEIGTAGRHEGLSVASVRAVRRIAHLIPETVPIILESQVPAEEIDQELAIARSALALEPVESEAYFTAVD
jgi:hypothetical protein